MSKRLMIGLVVAGLLLAAPLADVNAQDADAEAMLAVVDRYVHDIWGGWQFDIAEELIADDFVVHVWTAASDMDWDTYFTNIIEPTPTMQDFSLEYRVMFVDDDYVVAIGSWGGPAHEDMGDLPVVDNVIAVNGLDVYRFEDGKIAELWVTYDTMGYMQQWGYVSTEDAVQPNIPWDIALGETDTTLEENKALVAQMVQELTDHDMPAYFGHFTEDGVVHDLDGDMTRAEAEEMMIGVQTAWPDHHVEDVMYFVAGDLVVIMYNLVFQDDAVVFNGVNVDRIVEGQVAEEWWLYDVFTMEQLIAEAAEGDA